MERTGTRRWRKKPFDLTERQESVLRLIERGYSNGEIAERLGMTLDGAKFHVSEILGKLEVSSREEAVTVWKARQRHHSLPALGSSLRPIAICAALAVVAIAAVVAWDLANHDEGELEGAGQPDVTPVAAAPTAFRCPATRTPTATALPNTTVTPNQSPTVRFPFISMADGTRRTVSWVASFRRIESRSA